MIKKAAAVALLCFAACASAELYYQVIQTDGTNSNTVLLLVEGDTFEVSLTNAVPVPGSTWKKITFTDTSQDVFDLYDEEVGSWTPGEATMCEVDVLLYIEGMDSGRRVDAYLFKNGEKYKKIGTYIARRAESEITLNGAIKFRPTADDDTFSVYVRYSGRRAITLSAGSSFSGGMIR